MLLTITNAPSQSYPDGLYGRIRPKRPAALVHILSRKDERERLNFEERWRTREQGYKSFEARADQERQHMLLQA